MYEQNHRDNDRLRFENELKKIKLGLEHDTIFYTPADAELPLEIERIWLDQIQQFEDEFKKCKRILIYDKIGRPDFRKVSQIPDQEIELELDRLLKILFQKKILVIFIYDVDVREMYRIITEDLFTVEIDDTDIEGILCRIVYEK